MIFLPDMWRKFWPHPPHLPSYFCQSTLPVSVVTRKHERPLPGQPAYTVSGLFRDMAGEGVLLIFDEAHALKNKSSAQHRAAAALIEAVADSAGSACMLLSAMPCDKPEFVESVLRLLRMVRDTHLVRFNPARYEFTYPGIVEAVQACVGCDAKTAQRRVKRMGLPTYGASAPKGYISHKLFLLFSTQGLARVASAMPMPECPERCLKAGTTPRAMRTRRRSSRASMT